jgi:hypothetical protein
MIHRALWASTTGTLLGLMVLGGGCSDKESAVVVRQLQGTVEKMDLSSGRVTLRYLHEKTNEERLVQGSVTDETEIFVNGKLATLGDMRLGEHILVHGRVEKIGKERRITALRIDISRQETVSFPSPPPSE